MASPPCSVRTDRLRMRPAGEGGLTVVRHWSSNRFLASWSRGSRRRQGWTVAVPGKLCWDCVSTTTPLSHQENWSRKQCHRKKLTPWLPILNLSPIQYYVIFIPPLGLTNTTLISLSLYWLMKDTPDQWEIQPSNRLVRAVGQLGCRWSPLGPALTCSDECNYCDFWHCRTHSFCLHRPLPP